MWFMIITTRETTQWLTEVCAEEMLSPLRSLQGKWEKNQEFGSQHFPFKDISAPFVCSSGNRF